MHKSEGKIQQESLMWFNNTYCLRHHKPRCVMYSVPNEMAMLIRSLLLKERIAMSIIDRIIIKVLSTMKQIGMRSGASDSIVCVPSKVLFVEFKTSIGRQSKEQKEFEEIIKGLGLEYHLIRSLEEFQQLIATFF